MQTNRICLALSPYVETPVGAPFEMGRLDIEADGRTVIHAGTQVHGQGHETTYAQVVSGLLGIPFEKITMAWGDSDQLPIGGGTHADRSMRMMGTVLVRIVDDIVEMTKPTAAGLMQTETGNIEFADGKFCINDTGQGLFAALPPPASYSRAARSRPIPAP